MNLPFRNRKGRKKNDIPNNDISSEARSTSTSATTSSAASSLCIPSENDRRAVLNRVMSTAAAVYIHHGVGASMEMSKDPDLMKGGKAQKRESETARHDVYKQRLQSLYGSSFLHTISNCLLLTPDDTNDASLPTNDQPMDVFACVALLLYNYVLTTAGSKPTSNKRHEGQEGYDARIRTVLRVACVHLLCEAIERDDQPEGALLAHLERNQRRRLASKATEDDSKDSTNPTKLQSQLSNYMEEAELQAEEQGQSTEKEVHDTAYSNLYRLYAAKKFQALEQAIADKILRDLLQAQNTINSQKKAQDEEEEEGGRFSRKNLIRAAKVGGVGVAAGTLFAVTGGMAAVALGPVLASALGAVGIGGTLAALVASHTALVALFGVGGGGLSAYKMMRRTDGLNEFEIHREGAQVLNQGEVSCPPKNTAHLHTTVCISGWLTDLNDFQRPWGVTAANLDKTEILERFYSVNDPEKLSEVKDLLKPFEGNIEEEKEAELWTAFSAALEEQYGRHPDRLLPLTEEAFELSSEEKRALDVIHRAIMSPEASTSSQPEDPGHRPFEVSTMAVVGASKATLNTSSPLADDDLRLRIWDYQTEFGGDLYTIQWESAVLLKMCKVVNNMAVEMASKATQEVLKKTALASLMTAFAWPVLLLNFAGSIDNEWTLITIRSDLAGQELARCLLQSDERRPVNLIGFSFGGRVIHACLEELARHQAIWEEQQQEKDTKAGKPRLKFNRPKASNKIEYTREPASIVQDVVIMGTPIFVSRSSLRACRRMTAGRFINCYSKKDWILSLMFQYQNTSALSRGLCGTGPVEGVGGIENYDVSEIISSWHTNYCKMVPEILDLVGFDQPLVAAPPST